MSAPKPRKDYQAPDAPGLAASLQRIISGLRPEEEDAAVYLCRFCQDTGVVMKTEGVYDVGGVRGSMNYQHGKHRQVMATASVERPVFVRCIACNPVKPRDERGRKSEFGS